MDKNVAVINFPPEMSPGIWTDLRPNGETIFLQGNDARQLYYVRTGRIKLTVTSPHGKEAIVGIVDPGDFFGECAFNGRANYFATATTLIESKVTTITATSMEQNLKSNQQAASVFTTYLLRRAARLEDDLMHQLFDSAEKRLARLLLQLAEF